MASAKASSNDEGNKDKHPPSPRKASAADKTSPKRSGNNGVATPAMRKTSAGQTPKSAPAAAGGGPGGGVRKSPPKKPVEPSLLGDFLLGRPSAARQAAARRKSVDTTAVRQEMRQQMRQDAVRRVQRPGGVQSRVKQWQKTNAAAMVQGNPEDAASEPTEIAVFVDEQSVTEEDRVRIKYRENKAKRKSSVTPKTSPERAEDKKEEAPKESAPVDKRPKGPPKKRIVSDDNWMKRSKGTAPPKPAATGPKINPNFPKANKIKDWATKVELPESPVPPKIPNNHRPTKEYATKSGATITVEEESATSTLKSGRSREFITVEEDGGSSSRTWRTESGRSGDDGIRVRPMETGSPNASGDEGLRIKPTRRKESVMVDNGIRVKPTKSPLPDDGIRVRPIHAPESRSARGETSRETARRRSSAKRERTPTGPRHVSEEPETEVETPTRKSKSRASTRRMRRATAPTVTETTITRSDGEESWTSDDSYSQDDSERPSSAPAKSLADIPFGNSAFSELDLPVGADHHHFDRPKPQRNTSFNVVPKAFKKIMTGAKEIVHEKVDPPKPVVNQPPSIENWLNGTVDPFVEKPAPKGKTVEKEWEKDVRRRSSAEKPKAAPAGLAEPLPVRREAETPQTEPQRRPLEPTGQPPVGLKRSRATRANSSPLKQPTAKTPLRETLNNLFRGESSGHKIPTKAYSSYQELDTDSEPSYMDQNPVDDSDDDQSYLDHVEENVNGDPHVHSIDPQRASPPSPESSYISTDVSGSTEGPYMTPAIPRHRPPPTNGQYELSTIVSEGTESTVGSETMSAVSQSTVTQTTGLTRSSAISRRNKAPGLKRRLTKHSDLVSVLSLPDDAGPARASSVKSTSSLRRRTSNLEKVTVEDLLKEFSIDEDLYRRELKTLVDGAVPVLLTKVVNGNKDYARDLFSTTPSGQADTLGKAVVNMGVALERLKNLHRWAPLNDVDRILTWVFTAYPVYDKYLDVWRMGFEGIIVNLAPAPERLDDEDSLIGALPRNADGDVVDTEGQPVDLQRLLTRPLARIRGLLKLLRVSRSR